MSRFATLFLIFAIWPLVSFADVCDSLHRLKIADAKFKNGTLSSHSVALLLGTLDAEDFPSHARARLSEITSGEPMSVRQFGAWSRQNLRDLEISLFQCHTEVDFRSTDDDIEDEATRIVPTGLTAKTGLTFKEIAASFGIVAVLAGAIALGIRYQKIRSRQSERYLCLIETELSSIGAFGEGQIINVSMLGCQVKVKGFGAEKGDRIDISNNLFEVAAKIVWRNEHFLGVQFRTALSEQTLSNVLVHSRKRRQRRFGRASRQVKA